MVPYIPHVLPPEAGGPNPSTVRRPQQPTADDAKVAQARRQAAIDAQPSNRLLKAYRLYIGVKQCVEARKGYALVYLNDDQMADAKSRVIAIEKAMVAVDPAIDPNALWTKANGPEENDNPPNEIAAIFQLGDALGKRWLSSPAWVQESDDYCNRSHSALSDLYSITIPNANVTPKDF
ncbi:hypothetical protein ACN9MF_20040 [Methylobacterium fujisawaense]|uniref:hypothetical protein n=1 Tax=Methylobacterium fujisawaense TaxID=107400 RepID=UPI003CEA5319